MPMINLIEEQRLAAIKDERKAKSAFFTFVGAGVLTAIAFGLFSFEKDSLRRQEAKMKADIQKLAPVIAEIDKNAKSAGELSPRLKTLEEAQKATDRWSRILAHLTTQTPKDAWLTNMRSSSNDVDKPVNITISGIAKAQDPIGEFIMRMQNAQDLENVSLHYTQEKVGATGRAVDFELAADITGTVEQKPKDESKDGDKQ